MSGQETYGLLSKAPPLVANMDRDELGRLETAANACLQKVRRRVERVPGRLDQTTALIVFPSQLNGAETHKLVMLHTSDLYLKRVVQTTTAKRKGSDTMLKRAEELETQLDDTNIAAQDVTPKYQEVIATLYLSS